MAKHTEIVASSARAAKLRRIPPARSMPVFTTHRGPAFVSAKTVGSFVPGLTRTAFEKFGFSTAALITDWERIVGGSVASFTTPQRLKWPRLPGARESAPDEAAGRPGAMLVMKVDPARALEAEYAARQIIDRINAYFGYRAVADIRLVQAPINADKPAVAASRTERMAAAAPPAPVGEIADPALSQALGRLHAGIAGREKR